MISKILKFNLKNAYRISADDSLDQETSPSLFSPSQNTDPVLSNDESSQSIIGSRLIEINPMNGDEVEVHLRREKKVVYLRLLGELSTLILIVLTE